MKRLYEALRGWLHPDLSADDLAEMDDLIRRRLPGSHGSFAWRWLVWTRELVDLVASSPRWRRERASMPPRSDGRWGGASWIDVAQAGRSLRRSPGFTAVATGVLTIGLGTGAAILAISDAVLRIPLPIEDAARVRVLEAFTPADGLGHFSIRRSHLERYRQETATAAAVVGIAGPPFPFDVRAGEETLRLELALVGGRFFDVLGTPMAVGSAFGAEDDVFGAELVSVLSHRAWRETFLGDAEIVGRSFTTLDRTRTYRVVGVAPPEFDYPVGTEMWATMSPVMMDPVADTAVGLVDPLVRLRDGVPPQAAVEEFERFLRADADLTAIGGGNPYATERPIEEVVLGEVRPVLVLLMASVGLLLLIAAANVANLMLVRGSDRAREMAVRRSLGAAGISVTAQLAAEAALLVGMAALLAIPASRFLIGAFVRLAPDDFARIESVSSLAPPFSMVGILALVVFAVVGLGPTVYVARRSATAALLGGGRGQTASRRVKFGQEAVVAWQVALSLVVLNGAALVGLSLHRLQTAPTGFEPSGLYFVQPSWSWAEFGSEVRGFYREVGESLEGVPEVVAASPVLSPPFGRGWLGRYVLEGQTEEEASGNTWLVMDAGNDRMLETLGLPLVRGRAFTRADASGALKVVIVSEDTARRYWPGEDPLGKRLRLLVDQTSDAWLTVVGVVAESRYRNLREATPGIYYPHDQFERGPPFGIALRMSIGSPGAMRAVERTIESVDPRVDVARIVAFDELLAPTFAQPRALALVTTGFGSAALLLATVGLYAVLESMARRRRRELAIRQALGADARKVLQYVLGRGLLVAALGTAVGLLGALASARYVESLLYEVSPTSVGALFGAALLLLAAATAASYLPARRATRVPPRVALGDVD